MREWRFMGANSRPPACRTSAGLFEAGMGPARLLRSLVCASLFLCMPVAALGDHFIPVLDVFPHCTQEHFQRLAEADAELRECLRQITGGTPQAPSERVGTDDGPLSGLESDPHLEPLFPSPSFPAYDRSHRREQKCQTQWEIATDLSYQMNIWCLAEAIDDCRGIPLHERTLKGGRYLLRCNEG